MRRFIFGVLILVFSVWLGLRLLNDPGMVMFLYQGWSIEMPLWFAGLVFILFVYLLYGLLRFIDSIDHALYRWKNWLRWRRKYKSYSKTNRGLLELIEAHWRNAETYLLEGIEQSDAPLINYLAAAKAAHERGAYDKRDTYLRIAHELAPQEDVAIGLVQAELQMKQGQLEQALATLTHLHRLVPQHALVLKLLERVYVKLGDWKALVGLLPFIRKAKLVSADQFDKLEQNTYQRLLQTLRNKSPAQDVWQAAWYHIPKRLQKNPQLVFTYVKQLITYPATIVEAEDLMNKTIRKSWDPELVKLYGLLVTPNPTKQLAHAEAWLRIYPNQPALFLTLGRLSVACQLWGKARSYLEDSLNLDACSETYGVYAKLLEQLGDVSLAMKNYQRGLAVCG